MTSASASIRRTGVLLGMATTASRVVGYGRTILLAAIFGATGAIDPFFAAFRIPDLLFALSAAGSLSAGLVPVLATLRGAQAEERAHRVAVSAGVVVVGVTTVCAVIGVLLAEQIAPIAAPGFRGAARDEMVLLTRILFASPVLLGVSAVAAAVLSAHERFGAQAAAPLVYNGAIIAAALLGGLAGGGIGLAIGVIAGAALHALTHLLALRRAGIHLRLQVDLADPEARRALRLLLPRALSIGALQIIGAAVVAVASRGDAGTVTAYTIAFSLASLPVAIIGTSLGTALLPRVARLRGAGAHADGAREGAQAIMVAVPLLVAASLGLAGYAREIAALVLFGAAPDAVATIAGMLPPIAAAGLSYGLLAVMVRLRFAVGDGRSPLVAALGATLIALVAAPIAAPESAPLLLSVAGLIQLGVLVTLTRDQGLLGSLTVALRSRTTVAMAVAVIAPALFAEAAGVDRSTPLLLVIALAGVGAVMVRGR